MKYDDVQHAMQLPHGTSAVPLSATALLVCFTQDENAPAGNVAASVMSVTSSFVGLSGMIG